MYIIKSANNTAVIGTVFLPLKQIIIPLPLSWKRTLETQVGYTPCVSNSFPNTKVGGRTCLQSCPLTCTRFSTHANTQASFTASTVIIKILNYLCMCNSVLPARMSVYHTCAWLLWIPWDIWWRGAMRVLGIKPCSCEPIASALNP